MEKTQFSYTPLNRSKNEIRLIKLLPSSNDNAIDNSSLIECSIEYVSLDTIGDGDTYEALSYTWEDNVKMERIQLDGAPFPVTKNLRAALRALRSATPNSTRRLWVDAVCINQDDVAERNNEVLRMRQIYESASHVVVWLGESNQHTDVAFDALEYLSQKYGVQRRKRKGVFPWVEKWIVKPFVGTVLYVGQALIIMARHRPWLTLLMATYAFRLSMEGRTWRTRVPLAILRMARALCAVEFTYASMKTLWYMPEIREHARAPSQQVVDALKDIFTRSWFRRMWVIQEVFVSRSAVVMVGHRTLSWQRLHRACLQMKREVFRARRTRSPYLDTLFFRESAIQPYTIQNQPAQEDRTNGKDLLSLLVHFQNHQATDARDKVYALLGLATDVQGNEGKDERIKPKYEANIKEVYTKVASFMIDKSQDLAVFTACGVASTIENLPTWVPDWTTPSFRPMKPSKKTFKLSVPGWEHLPVADLSPTMEELTVRGFFVGSIYGGESISMELGGGFMAKNPWMNAFFTHGIPIIVWIAKSGMLEKVVNRVFPLQENPVLKDMLDYIVHQEKKLVNLTYENEDSIMPGAWGVFGFSDPDEGSTTLQVFDWVAADWFDSRDIVESLRPTTIAQDAREGDWVCLLTGAKCPVLLRREEDHFLLMGAVELAMVDYLWDQCEQNLRNGSIDLLSFRLR